MSSGMMKPSPISYSDFINVDQFAWALMIGGIAVALVSFLADDAVEHFVSATFEEFWMIMVVILLYLCISEWRSTKQPGTKAPPEVGGADEAPTTEGDTPHSEAGPEEPEDRRHLEISVLTAQYMTAMQAGHLALAGAAMERLQGLQASSERASLQQFCSSCYGELVRRYVHCGKVEKIGRWFSALVGTVAAAHPSKPGEAVREDEQKRYQEIEAFRGQICELVRRSVREGHAQKAEALLSILLDSAPVVHPDVACFTSVISACVKAGNVERADAWLAKMLAVGLRPDEASYSALVNAHVRRGDVEQAKGWLDRMREAFPGTQAQSYSFDLVLQACGQVPRADPGAAREDAGGAQGFSKLRAEAPEFECRARPTRRRRDGPRSWPTAPRPADVWGAPGYVAASGAAPWGPVYVWAPWGC